MAPLKVLLKYFLTLFCFWILVAYIVICFGAPLLSEHIETAQFVSGLCLHSIWPIVLIEGPSLDQILKVVQGQDLDHLGRLLQRNAFGAVSGAWLGAFPIPLDWDRPWQTWPLTCTLGCFIISFFTHIWSAYDNYCLQNKQRNSTLIGTINKKKTS